jgi:5-methylcytosine-specific restriction endonuclease McrA
MIRVALALALCLCATAHADPLRSRSLRAEFQRLNPCPANGATRGPCVGWQVDHVQPLCAGGHDELDNLAWLTVPAHRDKTRRDVAACRGRVYLPPA